MKQHQQYSLANGESKDDYTTLAIGDQVVDANRPVRSSQHEAMRIVTVSDRTADEHTLRGGDATVFSFNSPRGTVRRDERVLGCVVERHLDREAGGWWAHAPADILAKIAGDFGLRTFWFPESRLMRTKEVVN